MSPVNGNGSIIYHSSFSRWGRALLEVVNLIGRLILSRTYLRFWTYNQDNIFDHIRVELGRTTIVRSHHFHSIVQTIIPKTLFFKNVRKLHINLYLIPVACRHYSIFKKKIKWQQHIACVHTIHKRAAFRYSNLFYRLIQCWICFSDVRVFYSLWSTWRCPARWATDIIFPLLYDSSPILPKHWTFWQLYKHELLFAKNQPP